MKRLLLTPFGLSLILSSKAFGAAQLSQVLTTLGLEKTDVDALVALPDDSADFKPDAYVTKVSTNYETKLSNDPNFLGKLKPEQLPDALKKTIETGQYGRFMNEFRALATKQGIDLADLSEEEAKSLNKMGEKVFEKYKGKLGSPEAVTKLQADLQKALADKTAVETSVPDKIKEATTQVETKYQTALTKLIAANALQSTKGLVVKASLVVDSLLAKVRDKYNVALDGETITLTQKANPTLKALDAAGKEITFADAITAEAKAEDLIKEVKEEEIDPATGKGKVKVDVIDSTTVKLPDYIQKQIDANLKTEGSKK